MAFKKVLKLLILLFALSVDSNHCQVSSDITGVILSDAHRRHVHLRCLQQFPQAETVNYTETLETQCFLHCFLYKAGLMDLKTRGLDSKKIIDIWEKVEEALVEDNCLEQFYLNELPNGTCSASYRMLMEFRQNCLKLFEYFFTTNSTWKPESAKPSKGIGQSATEFCDFIDEKYVDAKENSHFNEEVSLLTQYKEHLKCIFENIHYLDAYGRVDESEIILSYQEAQEDSSESRAAVHTCAHRANAKFQDDYLGNLVLELQKCLKDESTVYAKVFRIRDENSRQY